MLKVCRKLLLLSTMVLTACASQPQLEGGAGREFTIDELKQRADVASYAGAYSDALLQYQQILEKEPDNVDALTGAGEALLAATQPVRANNYFERALMIDSKNIQAREARALSWLMSGKYAAARKSFLNLVDDGVDRWRIWNGLGVIADLDGDYVGSAGYYQKAIALASEKAMLRNNLGYSQIMGHNYAEAEASLRSALMLEPGNPRVVNNLSISIAWQHRYNEAVEQLKSVMDEPSSYNNVGYVAYLNGDYTLAEEFFRKAMRLRPSYYKRAASNLELVLRKTQNIDVPSR
jgi:Flp pilus assembly protein TadD